MSDEDLEAANHLGKRNGTVALPLFHRLNVVNVDHKVLLFALVVDLGLGSVSTRHFAKLNEFEYAR